MDELQARVSEAAAAMESVSQQSSERVPSALLLLIKHVQDNADFYRFMLGGNADQPSTHRFLQLAEDRYRFLFSRLGEGNTPNTPPVAMRLSYISYAGLGTIRWWLENHQPVSAEQLALWLGQLNMTSAGLSFEQLESASG